jgi:hypothetical protein
MSVKKTIIAAFLAIAAVILLIGCADEETTTTVHFVLTDSPVEASTIKAVNVTVSAVAVNESGTAEDSESSWHTMTIDPPVSANLLDLQGGVVESLGDIGITGGTQVNQIRLTVDSVSVVESDDSVHAATVPSATGFKIVNAFAIPRSGSITIAIDFDARKSIVKNNNGYTVKPAVRAVITGEAGKIAGSVGATGATIVYAYAEGTYSAAESEIAADGSSFPNAYCSTFAKDDASYVLAFMDEGTYDLVAASESGVVVGTLTGVSVASGTTTENQDF